MTCILCIWLMAVLSTTYLFKLWKKIGIRDFPSHRSAHSKAIPTAGGVCICLIFLGFYVATKLGLVPCELPSLAFILGVAILTVVGFIDDWKELNYKTRLLGHVIAVGVVLAQQSLDPVEYLLWFFIGAGLINACNFLDGLNGLLASQWLLTVGFLLSAFAPINSLFWILWLSTLVYLFFNFPKARVFVGDTGSTILGFSYFFIIFDLAPKQHEFPSFLFPCDSFVLFALFPLGFAWGDIVFTIARRVIEQRSVVGSFGDYGFHHTAKFLSSHALVTLAYLTLNCLLICGATALFFNHGQLFLVYALYVMTQLIHWLVIFKLSKKL